MTISAAPLETSLYSIMSSLASSTINADSQVMGVMGGEALLKLHKCLTAMLYTSN